MAKVEMTRTEVAEAIKRERLTAGTWARSGGQPGNEPVGAACSFCAVGAVVRAAMSAEAELRDVRDTADTLGNKNDYLCQLSEAFECAVADDDRVNLEVGRRAAIAFVMSDAFPDTITIDIGNAKPRRGMRVVS